MSIFPTVTEEKQKIYEEIYLAHPELKNEIPEICGYYGRACRQMNNKADRVLCNGCSLSLFISVCEAILERLKEKESLGIDNLYDSDIRDIQSNLLRKAIRVDYGYIERILSCLTE